MLGKARLQAGLEVPGVLHPVGERVAKHGDPFALEHLERVGGNTQENR